MVGLYMKEWLRGDVVTWWLVCWTPGWEVGKTLYFHNASLHPELKIGTSKLLVKSGEMPGGGGTLGKTGRVAGEGEWNSWSLHDEETSLSSGWVGQ